MSVDLLSNAVGESSNANITLSWSLGEIMVGDKNSGSARVTEGFYQTNIKVSAFVESDLLVNNNFKVYPNPISDNLHINYNQNTNDNWLLMLFDIRGRLIFKHDFTNKTVINVQDISKGVYVLKISDQKNKDYINYKVEKF